MVNLFGFYHGNRGEEKNIQYKSKKMGSRGLSRGLIRIFIILLLSACDGNENVKNDSTIDEVDYTELLEDFFNELSSIDNWDDTKDIFYKYYYKPDTIINNELVEYFLMDFELFWKIAKEHNAPYLKNAFRVYSGDSLKESSYSLTMRNNDCDECIVLEPLHNLDLHLDLCFKDGKIYSTIGTYDLDKEEYIWYRDKKHPPMRFK